MGFVKTKDGVEIYYKDWGKGQPIVFSHGWPLSADDWDNQMLFFLKQGYRVIAHDRRGHGRSSQVPDGHDLDHYADDLAAVTAHLDLKNAIHVGHSTGGGEVVRYLARHSDRSFVKAAIISAVPTTCRRNSWPIARSSIARFRKGRSTVTIGRARRNRKRSSPTGGARA
jgi:non-heme chloroperoxidase